MKEDQFIPHLIVQQRPRRNGVLQNVFGGSEGDKMMAPDGTRLMHGEVVLDGHKLFVSDEFRKVKGHVQIAANTWRHRRAHHVTGRRMPI
jgi:uncharacterized glyoxalase superfamily protein PhnB